MTRVEYERIPCPHCAGNLHDVFIAGKDLDTYRFYCRFPRFDTLNYAMCRECHLIFANPRLRYTDTTFERPVSEPRGRSTAQTPTHGPSTAGEAEKESGQRRRPARREAA